jgi:phage terminase small subunit
MRWWNWAWSTPQSTTWNHDGFTEALVKRAELEDLWETGSINPMVDPLKILAQISRLDAEFGFTPRSAAQLHLAFEEPEPVDESPPSPVADIRDRLKGLG